MEFFGQQDWRRLSFRENKIFFTAQHVLFLSKENLPKSPNFIWIRISGESVVILNLDIFFLLQIFKEGNAVITNKCFQIWLTALFRFTKDKTKYPINLHWLLESYLQFRVSSPIPNPRMGVIDFFLFLEVKFLLKYF